jgi:hypothetical protein
MPMTVNSVRSGAIQRAALRTAPLYRRTDCNRFLTKARGKRRRVEYVSSALR